MILHFVLLNSTPFLLMQPIRFSSSFYVISLSSPVLTVPSNFVSSGNFISRLPCAKIIKENVKKSVPKKITENLPLSLCFPVQIFLLRFSNILSNIYMLKQKNLPGILQSNLTVLYLCQLSHWSHLSKACRIHFIISIPG